MEEKQQFLDTDGLKQYHSQLQTDIKKKIKTETEGFISYTDDTTFEPLE